MREWIDVYRQLRDLLAGSNDRQLTHSAGLHPLTDRRNNYAAIHRSLMCGLLSNMAWRTADREFTGAGGRKLVVWPGSSLTRKPPKWIVAGELIETNRRYARMVARIQPEWVEPLAAHLLKREILEPHWDGKIGNVMAFEKLSLWGLPVVPRRRVSLAKHDPAKARELLIQHGLVELGLLHSDAIEGQSTKFADEERQLETGIRSALTPGRELKPRIEDETKSPWARHFYFLQKNADVLRELQTLQSKTRQRDLLPADTWLFTFYAEQIPDNVCDRERLRRWYQSGSVDEKNLLCLSLDQFINRHEHDRSREDFPSELIVGRLRLPLSYEMSPGQEADGVTLTVPVDALPQLTEDRISWLVPGMVEQKITALIRNLPKQTRLLFVPIPDTARQLCDSLQPGVGSLEDQTANLLSRTGGELVSAKSLRNVEIPEHLQMLIRVVDRSGRLLMEGRSLEKLRDELRTSVEVLSAEEPSTEEQQWHRRGFKTWEFDDIPVTISVRRAGIRLSAWPAIRDDGDSVSLTLCQSQPQAQAVLRRGLRRLCRILEAGQIRNRVRNLDGLNHIRLLASSIRGIQLQEHLELLMTERAYLSGKELPRTELEFKQCLVRGRESLNAVSSEFSRYLPKLFGDYHRTRRLLEESSASSWEPLTTQMKRHLNGLVHANFLSTTSWAWLLQFPRYFSCIRHRLQRLESGGMETELRLLAELEPHTERMRRRRARQGKQSNDNPMLEHYRWMLEEFCVQQFAPKLGTAISVSVKKLDEHWQKVP